MVITAAGSSGIHDFVSHEFDALGDEYFEDPAKHFDKVRKDLPVFWYPYLNSWVVTRKTDVEMILSDWKRFRNGTKGEGIHVPEAFVNVVPRDLFSNILIGSDPPRHTQSRAIAQRGFIKPRMDALEPVIEQRAHRIIDLLEYRGSVNLLEEYCLELTTQTFMALVGLPPEDEPMMRQLRDDLFMILGSALEPMQEPTLTEVWTRYSKALSHLTAIASERAKNPGNDLISEMASATDRDGNPAMRPEQVALHIGEFAGAATDTTAQAMANAVLFLSNNPEVREQVLADNTLWPMVFDETVRRRPSGTATRWATEDVEVGGVVIKKGDAVWLGLASANTDPDYYDNPFEFSLDRELGDHLAFTRGRHTCLGQPLARVQGATGLKVLYERLPSIMPADDFPLDFMQLALLPIRRTLPVHWDVAQDAGRFAPRTEVSEVIGAPAPDAHLDETMDVRVAKRYMETATTMVLEFEDPLDGELPEWQPGAHLDVIVGDGTARQFSLCSDPNDLSKYRLGILREEDGRGGSLYLHDQVRVGDVLEVGVPRNNFRLKPAKRYRFIAGGIGITPLLPMIHQAEAEGADWELLYTARDNAAMAFTTELNAYGSKVTYWASSQRGRVNLAEWLDAVDGDVAVYTCGPASMLSEIEEHAKQRPSIELHFEYFEPKDALTKDDDEAFDVEFVDSGKTVTVEADQTILDVAEKIGINVFSSCQEGTCGTCETPMLAGRADHRDSLLTDDEKEQQDAIMICVSRAEKGCPKLRLQL